MSDPAREALMTPPTELEISKLLAQLTPAGALILRRLCLQRDAALDREREKLTQAREIVGRMREKRRSFEDGTWMRFRIIGGEDYAALRHTLGMEESDHE